MKAKTKFNKKISQLAAQEQYKAKKDESSTRPKMENILLSDLVEHLKFDFEDGEIIGYRIRFKQPKGIREIRYPTK